MFSPRLYKHRLFWKIWRKPDTIIILVTVISWVFTRRQVLPCLMNMSSPNNPLRERCCYCQLSILQMKKQRHMEIKLHTQCHQPVSRAWYTPGFELETYTLNCTLWHLFFCCSFMLTPNQNRWRFWSLALLTVLVGISNQSITFLSLFSDSVVVSSETVGK